MITCRILFSGFEDQKLKVQIESKGGILVNNITQGVDIIVYVREDDMEKAKSFYNIRIFEKEEFINKYFNTNIDNMNKDDF